LDFAKLSLTFKGYPVVTPSHVKHAPDLLLFGKRFFRAVHQVFSVSGDPKAMEYGNFGNVRQECKENCPHKRSSDHGQRQRCHGNPTIRHR
jgi:hypothetical protein